jgi:hypothetical protein
VWLWWKRWCCKRVSGSPYKSECGVCEWNASVCLLCSATEMSCLARGTVPNTKRFLVMEEMSG